MRILIDARMYGLENTGIGKYIMELITNLQKVDQQNNYYLILREKYYKELVFTKNFEKIKGEFRQYSFLEQIRLPKIIKQTKPDLIHFPHFNVPVMYKGSYLVTIHDLLMHKQKGFEATTLNPMAYLTKRLAYRLVFDTGIKRAKKIIVPSQTIKKELLGYYQIPTDKVIVTYEGASELAGKMSEVEVLEKYKLTKPYFIYTGNAYPHKNINRLIEAILALNKDRHRQAQLIIGSARSFFVQKLAKLVKANKAQAYIKISGFIPEGELGVLYQNATAFVFPTLSEGFGLPGLDAMQAGTLVLASEIPVLKEVYKEHAIYFNPYDYSSITETLEQALDISKEEREARISNAKDFVKRYSWHKMAQETLSIYENCARLR